VLFRRIRAAGFRNFALVEADLGAGSHFIRGENGQGKTNLLEAMAFVSSLRSFRTVETGALIGWEAEPKEAVLLAEIEHDELGDCLLEIRLRNGQKSVLLDGERVERMADFVGRFPTICFSSQDIQLIRGSPAQRRRFLDMMLVVMDPDYIGCLTRYHHALKSRNALLRQRAGAALRRPFEAALAREGADVVARREELLDQFRPHFKAAYATISGIEESPEVLYRATLPCTDADTYAESLQSCSHRDEDMGTTTRGAHRDDLEIRLQGHAAKEFASEGQQRGLVLALRLGLVEWYRNRGGTQPVILADDIVGELDGCRRNGFWAAVGTARQIIATGTHWPEAGTGRNWARWEMEAGRLVEGSKGV
jgi:DNA replication and repair protein RecF